MRETILCYTDPRYAYHSVSSAGVQVLQGTLEYLGKYLKYRGHRTDYE
jgi:hypothetical protein